MADRITIRPLDATGIEIPDAPSVVIGPVTSAAATTDAGALTGGTLDNARLTADVRLRPTNTSDFTPLTNQRPDTFATFAPLTLTGDANAAHPVAVASGLNAEASIDGVTWGQFAVAPVGSASPRLRFTAPAFGYQSSGSLAINGRTYTGQATSAEFDPTNLTHQRYLGAYLLGNDAGSPFRQHIDGTTTAANFTEPVRWWGSTRAVPIGYCYFAFPDESVSLDVINDTGLGNGWYLQGKGTVGPFTLRGVPPTLPEFTCLLRVRQLVLDTGGNSWFGPGWSANARFYGGDAGTGMRYYDDVLGATAGGGLLLSRPSPGTWFTLGIRRNASGVVQVTAGTSLSWVTAGTNAGLTFAPVISPAGGFMTSQQQVNRFTLLPWFATDATNAAVVSSWG